MAKKTALKKLKYGDEFKIKNWKCTIDRGLIKGDLISCISKEGILASIFSDETIRFSKDNCDIKIDGKRLKALKEKCGIELS